MIYIVVTVFDIHYVYSSRLKCWFNDITNETIFKIELMSREQIRLYGE